jgi:haloacetate dehalogenase
MSNATPEADVTVLPELFPGFDTRLVPTRSAEIFCRIGGAGPPLVLIHGFPQTHAEWHRIAPALAERFTVVLPDLRGYGASSVPPTDPLHRAYSKRVMAEDICDVMSALGHHGTFRVVGHDRGARVGYRLALDHPMRIEKLAVLDIVPTHAMWTDFTVPLAMKVYHWLFLAQPKPLPEMLIGQAPVAYLDYTIASWTKAKNLSAFDEGAMAHYRAFYAEPDRLSATCEDYRAGQTIDFAIDSADVAAGKIITCPVLALWGAAGIPAKGDADGPLAVWRRWASDLRGEAIDAGHFLPEENPDATLRALLAFL